MTEAGVSDCHGEYVYRYAVDERWFLLIDQHDRGGDVVVIDVVAERWNALVWSPRPYHAGSWEPDCTCREIRFDDSTGLMTKPCIHYQVWLKYFRDYIEDES